MAFYTEVDARDLGAALSALGLVAVAQPRGVAEGIENSTYFLRAARRGSEREYVLTLLENVPLRQMHFSARLCQHLNASGLPVPAPLADSRGEYCFEISGRPALFFPRAAGGHPSVTADHCRVLGAFMARMHRAGETFVPHLPNSRGLDWMQRGASALQPHLCGTDRALVSAQLAGGLELVENAPALPSGTIHGDLFTDNTLFAGTDLCGVIDFYNACNDWLLLDVAIAVNDWCASAAAELDSARYRAFIGAYHRIRPFVAAERQAWQTVLALAATRFWISRLLAHHVPELLGGAVKIKDPGEYRQLLARHLAGVPPLPGGG